MSELPKVLVTDRVDAPPDGTVVSTPGTLPNFQVVVVPAVLRALTRAVRVYLMTFVGLLLLAAAPTAGALPDPLPIAQAWPRIVAAAGMALFPAFVSLCWNAIELLAKVDERLPELRG
jgi:hypothetical protein